jgi:hypothetical protein
MNSLFSTKMMIKLTYMSFMVWAVAIFSSISLSALGHIMIFIPALFFTYQARAELKKRPLSHWMLLAIVVSGVISVLANYTELAHPLKNIVKLKYFFIAYIGVFATIQMGERYLTPKRIKRLFNTFLVATTLATTSGLIALFTGFNPLKFKAACHATRACGMYGMYMTYGYGIQFVVVMLVGVWLYRKKFAAYITPTIFYVALVLNGLGLILSYARGGWIGGLFGILTIIFFKNRRYFFISCVALIIVGGGLWQFNQRVRDTFLSPNRLASNAIRISQFQAAWYAFKEKPVWGVGYRNFEPLSKKIKQRYSIGYAYFGGHAHNNFFEHLASTGAVGFLVLLIFHLAWFWEAVKRQSAVGYIVSGVVMSLFVSGMFQYTLGDGENLFLLMAIYMLFSINTDCIK